MNVNESNVATPSSSQFGSETEGFNVVDFRTAIRLDSAENLYRQKFWTYNLFFLFIYLAQNAFLSYYSFLNSIYLQENDVSFAYIGLFGFISLLPLILKVFIGLMSDKVRKRKIFIAFGLLLKISSLLLLIFVSPTTFGLFLTIMIFVMLGLSFYDTTTDGLAVNLSKGQTQDSTIQTFMGIGNAVGNIFVTAFLGIVVYILGWSFVFLALALISIIPLLFVWKIQEIQTPYVPGLFSINTLKVFIKPEIVCVIGYSVVFGMSTYGFAAIVFPYVSRQLNGLSILELSILASVMAVGNILGVILSKLSLSRWSYPFVTKLAPMVHIPLVLSLLLLVNKPFSYPLLLILGASWGYRTNVFFSVAMHFTEKYIAAFMYSVLMAFANVGISVGNLTSALMVQNIGFIPTFIIIASYNVVAIILAHLMFSLRKEESEIKEYKSSLIKTELSEDLE